MQQYLQDVPLEKAYRLLNLGATALISAAHDGKEDVMAAAWNCALDLNPCKCTVVIDHTHYTRALMDADEYFAVSIPTVGIVREVPLVEGCAGYLIFKKISEPHNEKTYDLFIGQCVKAAADSRVFRDGHYHYAKADPSLRTLHYVAGGPFFALGEEVMLDEYGLD